MKVSKFRIKISDEDYISALRGLEYDPGYQILYNHLADEIDELGEQILDDILDELDPKVKEKLTLLRYLKKDLLKLPENLINKKQEEMEGKRPVIDDPNDQSLISDPY